MMSKTYFAIVCYAMLQIILIGAFTTVLPAERLVVISEIMVAPETNNEWIELYNLSYESFHLSEWYIIDRSNNIGILSDVELQPNQYLVIAKDYDTLIDLGLTIGINAIVLQRFPTLNDDGDYLKLLKDDGEIMDEIEYVSDAARVKGRSWERVSLNKSGMMHTNWGPTIAAKGHTAGKENSLQPKSGRMGLFLSFSSNPFNPDRGELTITINSSIEVGRLSIDVYNSNHELVIRLASNIPSGIRNTIRWNGKDMNNTKLPLGRYILRAEALDLRNGKRIDTIQTVVIAY